MGIKKKPHRASNLLKATWLVSGRGETEAYMCQLTKSTLPPQRLRSAIAFYIMHATSLSFSLCVFLSPLIYSNQDPNMIHL